MTGAILFLSMLMCDPVLVHPIREVITWTKTRL